MAENNRRTLRRTKATLLAYLEENGYHFEPPTRAPEGVDLYVHHTGNWFVLPPVINSPRLNCRKFVGNSHGASTLLRTFVEAHLEDQRWVSMETFFEAIWPDDTHIPRSNQRERLYRLLKIFLKTAFKHCVEVRTGFRRLRPHLKVAFGTLDVWPDRFPRLDDPNSKAYWRTAALPGSKITNAAGTKFPLSLTARGMAEHGFFPGVPTPRGFISLEADYNKRQNPAYR
tara:strand:- start:96 stop:779 length:684 start_codon:yes stop_codon:yes gene_type:complete